MRSNTQGDIQTELCRIFEDEIVTGTEQKENPNAPCREMLKACVAEKKKLQELIVGSRDLTRVLKNFQHANPHLNIH